MTAKQKEPFNYLSARDYENYFKLYNYWHDDVKGYSPRPFPSRRKNKQIFNKESNGGKNGSSPAQNHPRESGNDASINLSHLMKNRKATKTQYVR